MKQAGRRGYGVENTDTSQWIDKDWACHTITQILDAQDLFVSSPSFGPHEGENELEAWNRAYQLLLCAIHYSAHSKYGIIFNEDAAKNYAAIKPPFMMTEEEHAATS